MEAGRGVAALLVAGFAAALGLLAWLSERDLPTPQPLLWLGAISYALYLTHLYIYVLLRGVENHVGDAIERVWPMRLALQFAIVLAVAGVVHRLFERPITRWLNRRTTVLGIPVA